MKGRITGWNGATNEVIIKLDLLPKELPINVDVNINVEVI